MKLTPKQLDAQSPVKIDQWVDLDSERWREVDDMPELTKRWLKIGFKDPAFFFVDSLGRVWGKGNGDKYYPFHLEYGKKLIGIRISKKAAN